MTECFKNNNLPHPLYAERLLKRAISFLYKKRSTVLQVSVPKDGRLIIVGDTHGQYIDLLTIFARQGLPSEKNVYVFNGDYVDRGPQGMCIVFLLYALMLYCPKGVYLNRGNHEQQHMNERFNFQEQVEDAYTGSGFGIRILDLFERSFECLAMATVLDGKVVVLHGGIPPDEDFTIEQIARYERINPYEDDVPYADLFECILWSDPTEKISTGFVPNRRGVGVEWSKAITDNFLDNNGYSLIIRSHEVKDNGYEYTHGGRVLTLFSASVYCGASDNLGAVAVYDATTGILPGIALPTIETYYAVATTSVGDACQQMTVHAIKKDFFMIRHLLVDAFSRIDKFGTGTVSVEEFTQALHSVMPYPVRWEVLWPYFTDTDDDGRINYVEFLSEYRMTAHDSFLNDWVDDIAVQVCKKLIDLHDNLQKSFEAIDTDGSKDISYQEFLTALRKLDLGLADENIYDLFQSMDTSGNGRLEFDEFSDKFSTMFRKLKLCRAPTEWCQQMVVAIAEHFAARYNGSLEAAFLDLDPTHRGLIPRDTINDILTQIAKQQQQQQNNNKKTSTTTNSDGEGEQISDLYLRSLIYFINNTAFITSDEFVFYAAFKEAYKVAKSYARNSDEDSGSLFYSSILSSISRTFQKHSVQLKRFFNRMDVDLSGGLSLTEFRVGMHVMNKLLDRPLTDSQIEKLFNIIDVNGDHNISFEEFIDGFTLNKK